MLDKFVLRLFEQSLDELAHKNLALIVPLSGTKTDNICRSQFGSNQVTIDFRSDVSVADACVAYTNAKDDGVLILKNISDADLDQLKFLTEVLSERQISLRPDDQGASVKIQISNCPIITLLGGRHDLPADLAGYFNIWLDISSQELPAAIEGRLDNDSNSPNVPNQDFDVTLNLISQWRDEQRTADIDADLNIIENFILRGENRLSIDNLYTTERRENALSLSVAYINYLIDVCHHYGDLLAEVVEPALCSKDGPYSPILVNIYNAGGGDEVSTDEFKNDEDCRVHSSMLFDYFETRSEDERNELLYRILACLKHHFSFQDGTESELHPSSDMLTVPDDFEIYGRQTLADDFRAVCGRLFSDGE